MLQFKVIYLYVIQYRENPSRSVPDGEVKLAVVNDIFFYEENTIKIQMTRNTQGHLAMCWINYWGRTFSVYKMVYTGPNEWAIGTEVATGCKILKPSPDVPMERYNEWYCVADKIIKEEKIEGYIVCM